MTIDELQDAIKEKLKKLSEDDIKATERSFERFLSIPPPIHRSQTIDVTDATKWWRSFQKKTHEWETDIAVMSEVLLGKRNVDHAEGECDECDLARLRARRAQILNQVPIISPEKNLTSRLTLELIQMQRAGFDVSRLSGKSTDDVVLEVIEAGIATLQQRIENKKIAGSATKWQWNTARGVQMQQDFRPDMIIFDDVVDELREEATPLTATGVAMMREQAIRAEYDKMAVDLTRYDKQLESGVYTVPTQPAKQVDDWITYTGIDQSRLYGMDFGVAYVGPEAYVDGPEDADALQEASLRCDPGKVYAVDPRTLAFYESNQFAAYVHPEDEEDDDDPSWDEEDEALANAE